MDIVERLRMADYRDDYGDLPAEAADKIKRLRAENAQLKGALVDLLSGWKYIREAHGDLYGVGWDRAQTKAEAALRGEEG